MWSPVWDDEAENYLRTVLSSRSPQEVGGVPGMYPTTGFEVLWIASTLLEDGFDTHSIPRIGKVLTMIREYHESLDGFDSGFSKSSVPDADDTSKSIILCNLLSVPTNVNKLVKKFEGKDHFLTYMMERHPSVTTNCNVLSALLVSPDLDNNVHQIEKCAKFLCASWTHPDIPFQDKWNISKFYPIMLLSQALCRLLSVWDRGNIQTISEELLIQDVSLVLFQVLMQTLMKQNLNGSWGHILSKEITAYAIIALGNLASLPLSPQLQDAIRQAIENGRQFINTNGVTPDVEYVWIAKTNYSPINVSKAYILAGLATNFPKYRFGPSFGALLDLPRKAIQIHTHMFSSLPTLKGFPFWKIEGSVTEARLFLGRLQRSSLNLYDRGNLKGNEYFEFIAMALTCSNNLHGTFLKTEILFNLMKFILHVYQVDEYFEHVIGVTYANILPEIRLLVERLLRDGLHETRNSGQHISNRNGHLSSPPKTDEIHDNKPMSPTDCQSLADNGTMEESMTGSNGNMKQMQSHEVALTEIAIKIGAYINAVLGNTAVQMSDPADRALLKHELRLCLLAHIKQLEDSKSHSESAKSGAHWETPCGSYHEWVRTLGAAHSCSPLSLAFFRCLLPQDVAGHLVTAQEQYFAQDLWVHLANRARMDNDRSSVHRDRLEGNLNSLDFPEFNRAGITDTSVDAITQLTGIIDYEKRCCELGFQALESVSTAGRKNSQLNGLRFYSFLVDLYNDVYVLKDISSKRNEGEETVGR